MPDKDIVLAKVATIQRCLDRIRDVTVLTPKALKILTSRIYSSLTCSAQFKPA